MTRPCYACGGTAMELVFDYTAPPKGETVFPSIDPARYRRQVTRCGACGHFMSTHAMWDTAVYGEQYMSSTYGKDGLRRAFERIVGLDPARSDNIDRSRRVNEFARARAGWAEDAHPHLLDVGSGLCVFPHQMKKLGWSPTALDPDPSAVEHARSVVGVEAACGDYTKVAHTLGNFDVVTFNKVLEHVEDPVGMLRHSLANLRPGGLVYVELPDGEVAVEDGPGREEFFIEHFHVFSMASYAILAARAGFRVVMVERLQEPSTKFTLRGFLAPAVS